MHHTEGIILSYYNIGEADRMLSIYTKDFGLIEVFAKSVRLSKSKFSAHVILFSKVRIAFVEGRDFLRLTYAHSAYQIGDEKEKLAVAGRICRLMSRLVRGQEPDYLLWRIFDSAFLFLKNSKIVSGEFEILFGARLLSRLGYVGEVSSDARLALEDEDWNPSSDRSYLLFPIFQKGLRVSQL